MVKRAKLTIDHSSGWATRVIHPRAIFNYNTHKIKKKKKEKKKKKKKRRERERERERIPGGRSIWPADAATWPDAPCRPFSVLINNT